nr:unnamed protein product [Callosobruchus chinensis]
MTDLSAKSQEKLDLSYLDPDFYRGSSKFEFPNGDIYEGEFCAHRSGLVWREGLGVYTTKDGQTYKGSWLNDKLINTVEIRFPGGNQYHGELKDSKYNGDGMFVTGEDLAVICKFVDNKPSGDLLLLDFKGHEWHGVAGDNSALFYREHVYFNDINKDYGKGKSRVEKPKRRVQVDVEEMIDEKRESFDRDKMKELELRIFAKTQKTVSDLKFADSTWYQNYLKFREKYQSIKEKMDKGGSGSLEEEEREWLEKYKEFKVRYEKVMNRKKRCQMKLDRASHIFELFHSHSYRVACPGIPVFYGNLAEKEEAEPAEEEVVPDV